jgi:hypothetical protein
MKYNEILKESINTLLEDAIERRLGAGLDVDNSVSDFTNKNVSPESNIKNSSYKHLKCKEGCSKLQDPIQIKECNKRCGNL